MSERWRRIARALSTGGLSEVFPAETREDRLEAEVAVLQARLAAAEARAATAQHDLRWTRSELGTLADALAFSSILVVAPTTVQIAERLRAIAAGPPSQPTTTPDTHQ